jgi:hypothetical protein
MGPKDGLSKSEFAFKTGVIASMIESAELAISREILAEETIGETSELKLPPDSSERGLGETTDGRLRTITEPVLVKTELWK